jgi:predicted lipase
MDSVNGTAVLTGHSLGGALAQLAAVELAQQGYNISLMTFGSPRVGDGTFANIINSLVSQNFRVTHWRDPVVHVPLAL